MPPEPTTNNARRMSAVPVAGLAVCAFLAAAATGLAALIQRLPEPASLFPASPVLFALAAGVLLAPIARKRNHWQSGLEVACGPLLRLAVMLIGLRLGLGELFQLGLGALPLVLAVIGIAGGGILVLGRLTGVPRRLAALLAVGSAICGVSAIAALAPAIRARPEETAYAVACIAGIGLVATLVYPFALHAWLPDAHAIGTAMGAAIYDTAQVTGAALLHEQIFGSETTLGAASVTKLMRNLGMLAVIPLLAWMVNRAEPAAGTRPAFPLFVLGFVGFSALRTVVDWTAAGDSAAWEALLEIAGRISAFGFAMALAALGMRTDLSGLAGLGWRPAAITVLTAMVILALAVAWLR